MKKFLSTLMIIFLLIPSINTYAANRSYDITDVTIDAVVNADGTITVDETQSYKFQGSFNGVFRNLKLDQNSQYIINKVSVIDENGSEIEIKESNSENNNTYKIIKEGSYEKIKVFTKSSNEEKKLNINYTIENPYLYLNDSNLPELKWCFYEVENVSSINNATLKLSLSNIALSDKNSRYQTEDNDNLNTFYEDGKIVIRYTNLSSLLAVNLTMPKDYFTVSLESYNNIENSQNKDSDSNVTYPTIAFCVILSTLGVSGFIISKNRKKKREEFERELNEYRKAYIFDDNYNYSTPPKDFSPALVNLLYNDGTYVDENMVISSLFYLTNKGYYEIEEKIYSSKKLKSKEGDLYFKVKTNIPEPKEKNLRYLLRWFNEYATEYGKTTGFSLLELSNKLKKSQAAENYIKKEKRWKEIIMEDGDTLKMTLSIRNNTVLTNEYLDEKNKWLSYKNYITEIVNNTSLDVNTSVINDIVIYASALDVNPKALRKYREFIQANNNFNTGSINEAYRYNYLNYYPLFYFHMNNIQNNSNFNASSSSSGGFTGGFGGGGFSGGGGGGGGAF